jgi:hypothetical protein
MESERSAPSSKGLPLIPILSQINQSIPQNPVSLRYILIFSTNLPLDLPSGLFTSGYPTNLLYASFFSLVNAASPVNLNLLDFIILIILGTVYKLRNSSLCSFLHSPVTSSLLGPNIILSTLFSNTIIPCFLHSVRDQVSRPHTTKRKIIILYIVL